MRLATLLFEYIYVYVYIYGIMYAIDLQQAAKKLKLLLQNN